jgi:aspartate racemase
MGPAAAAHFCLRLAESTAAVRDQDHLHVLLDSDPSVPDRTAFLLGDGEDPVPALIAMAGRLVRAGADLLVMACNSASPFTTRVAAAVPVAVVDWAAEAARAVAGTAPVPATVGLLGTDGTARAGLYQRRLREHGITAIVPGPDMQAALTAAIYDVKAGLAGMAGRAARRAGVLEAARSLAARGAGALLIACTELSLLFSEGGDWPVPAIDALDAVAASTVIQAGGTLRADRLISPAPAPSP